MSRNLHYLTETFKDVLPDYDNCSVNMINSLLRYYGCEQYHHSLNKLDEYLKPDHKHIFLIILDGMGTSVIDNDLPSDSFLRINHRFDIKPVYPCTTVAATTSLQTGKTPIENGWLGWHQYIPPVDKDITLFTNTIYHENKQFKECNVGETYLAYTDILNVIASKGIKTYALYPSFKRDGYNSFAEVCAKIAAIAETEERSFTYVYWDQPDSTMHFSGCYDQSTKDVLGEIDQQLSEMSKKLGDDSLILITPDHGMIDVEEVSLAQYEDVLSCLLRPVSMETRCNNFFVKQGERARFEMLFERYFSDFVLLSKQEVIKSEIFRTGTPHPLAYDMIGDYVALATGKRIIKHENGNKVYFKAHHAGLTKEEMVIPLIIYSKTI